jgi:hypothetical protein
MGLPHLLCMSHTAYWDHVLLHTQMQVTKMLILTVRIILKNNIMINTYEINAYYLNQIQEILLGNL